MTPSLVYYHPTLVARGPNRGLTGIARFSDLFKVLNRNITLVDRTGTFTAPLALKSIFPMPKEPFSRKTFEEICNERAIELLHRIEQMGTSIYVFWSGGIDSTLVLVSLLKNSTAAQRHSITVMLSEESISEYPAFYRDHIRGKLKVDSGVGFPYLLGSPYLFVNGEHNDQLFGSDMCGKLIVQRGPDTIHERYTREALFEFFNANVQDAAVTNFYIDLFERLRTRCPIEVVTNYDFLWWINFNMKWQSVFLRTLSYVAARNAKKITAEYIEHYYAPFFCTDEFQRWSLTNPDLKIKRDWTSYKWVCKEIIYDYTKDADYRDNKVKRGSLFHLLLQNPSFNFITDDFEFLPSIEVAKYHRPQNDFN